VLPSVKGLWCLEVKEKLIPIVRSESRPQIGVCGIEDHDGFRGIVPKRLLLNIGAEEFSVIWVPDGTFDEIDKFFLGVKDTCVLVSMFAPCVSGANRLASQIVKIAGLRNLLDNIVIPTESEPICDLEPAKDFEETDAE